ncbi:MBL fold metallo-hydrolase [Roseiconus nitratireducens]|uniref:MBL fold metallo-hydrolase n=1 Tax=Roseiconus nitratireducens TaxID=2605748 RepID=A0A5M6DFK2_9BACT|nr:MBL fold metallo-hydrolase [Roseiconus nitratireducens]KAA5545120.1 MBL fold metallo-hydrolase [Roseiconus nitratireducens]
MCFVAESSEPHRGLVTFLGTGTSVGVPAIGCGCAVCQSNHPRNQRTRCAITVRLPGGTLLVDTPPDLRTQLIRERVRVVHAVLFTHEHADHIFGLDDLRLFPFRLGHAVPLYCNQTVEKHIRRSFAYAFLDRQETHPGATPRLEFRSIDDDPVQILGAKVVPIPMKHGPHFNVLGFRFGNFAYCTDTNEVPAESRRRLQGIETLVIGALRHEPHPTHFNLEQAIAVARDVGAKRTLLTHTGHQLDYEATNQELPEGVEMAYDGMQVEIDLQH